MLQYNIRLNEQTLWNDYMNLLSNVNDVGVPTHMPYVFTRATKGK